jgi:hypothetical protein
MTANLRYQAYLRSLAGVYELPGGWQLVRVDEDLCGFELRNTRYPLVGLCGIVRHDIAEFAEAMNVSSALRDAYRRSLEACVLRLAVLDPASKVLLTARALLAEQPAPPISKIGG